MNRAGLIATAMGLSLGLYGCSAPSESGPVAPESSPAAAVVHDEHGDHAHTGHDEHARGGQAGQSGMDAMMAGLSKLSAEDRASAEKQHICPVGGDMLGMMGPPLKIDVNGQQVWICCEGCKEELLANPERYLAKLHEGSSHE